MLIRGGFYNRWLVVEIDENSIEIRNLLFLKFKLWRYDGIIFE